MENVAKAQEHGVRDVLVQADREARGGVWREWHSERGLVSGRGGSASALALGSLAITELVESATAPGIDVVRILADPLPPAPQRLPAKPSGLAVGDKVPAFEWVALDGRTVSLSAFREGSVALVFWNPRCGFCAQLLGELVAWERSEAHSGPRLVVISTGTGDENRALGLRSPIILEHGFDTGQLFGATGTPSAVRIGSDGRVATPVATGGAAVLELLSADPQAVLEA